MGATEVNPYAAPRADLDGPSAGDERPWWIQGRMLHARKGATLPPICIFSGVPAPGQHERRQLSWTPAWFKVLVVVLPMIAIFAYSVMRRSGDLEYALGPEARKRRRIGTAIVLVGCGGSLGALFLALADGLPLLALAALALFLTSLLVGSARARMFRTTRIDERTLRLELTAAAAQALAQEQAASTASISGAQPVATSS